MDEQVEPNGTETGALPASTPSNAKSSTPPAPAVDVNALVNDAVDKTRREAQASKDREIARLHQQYQQRERALKDEATGRLKQLGDQGADDWGKQVDVYQKAQQFDAIQSEAQQWAVWNAHVATVAGAHGLNAADPRLVGAASSDDLLAKAKQAMAEDATKERERLLKEAANAKVNSGDLDTLGGGPAAPASGLEEQFKKEMLAAKGKGMAAGRAIREKYRARGVDPDSIRTG